MTDATMHLLVLLAVSWIYLTVVRFVDVNEREPVWSLATAFALGGIAAALVSLLVNPVSLLLSPWTGAAAEEIGKALAYIGCLLVFTGVARTRGWFELNDLVDGIVYGIAIGLGFSVGATFLKDLAFVPDGVGSFAFHPGRAVVNGALAGLGHGLFGGVTGIGVGLAVETRGKVRRAMLFLLALGGAIALNGGFRALVQGNSLGGSAGYLRVMLAVALPLVCLVAIGLIGLARERNIIQAELAPEVAAGTLTADDLALLGSFWRRQLGYAGLLAGARVQECLSQAGRHNRLVQLALAKARLSRSGGGEGNPSLGGQIAALHRALKVPVQSLLVLLILFGSVAVAGARRTPAQFGAQPDTGVTRVLGIAAPDLDAFWRRQFLLSIRYSTPHVGIFTNAAGSCTFVARNAVFCKRDGNIYYDAAFLNELYTSIGDFAPVLVLAHEWGHKIQHVRSGIDTIAPLWPIQSELLADCYAGEWFRSIGTMSRLNQGDEGEALQVLNRGRDPRGSPWNDPQAHGTAGQRVEAFQVGRDGISCRSDTLWTEVRLDPATAQTRPTPNRGSLLGTTLRTVGRFNLVDLRSRPDWLSAGMVEFIYAKYQAPDGTEVLVGRVAMTTPARAEQELAADSTSHAGKGYSFVRGGSVTAGETVLGRWILMTGPKDVIVMSNRHLYGAVIGPEGVAWEFASAAPVL